MISTSLDLSSATDSDPPHDHDASRDAHPRNVFLTVWLAKKKRSHFAGALRSNRSQAFRQTRQTFVQRVWFLAETDSEKPWFR